LVEAATLTIFPSSWTATAVGVSPRTPLGNGKEAVPPPPKLVSRVPLALNRET
jgi:hypothetical protein